MFKPNKHESNKPSTTPCPETTTHLGDKTPWHQAMLSKKEKKKSQQKSPAESTTKKKETTPKKSRHATKPLSFPLWAPCPAALCRLHVIPRIPKRLRYATNAMCFY